MELCINNAMLSAKKEEVRWKDTAPQFLRRPSDSIDRTDDVVHELLNVMRQPENGPANEQFGSCRRQEASSCFRTLIPLRQTAIGGESDRETYGQPIWRLKQHSASFLRQGLTAGTTQGAVSSHSQMPVHRGFSLSGIPRSTPSAVLLSGGSSDLLDSNVEPAAQKDPQSRTFAVSYARRNFVDASTARL